MNKKKRFVNGFTNWLFSEYKAPRIPVKVMYKCEAIVDDGSKCSGYFGYDNEELVILVAAKKLGLTKCLFVIAHEFTHYMQYLNHRDMSEKEIIEEDAYYYEVPLVGKYLYNKRKKDTKITGVLDITIPMRTRLIQAEALQEDP